MSEPRNIRVTPEVMDRWWTRDYDGNRLRVEWGEPGPDGFYEPTITVDYSDNICARLRRIEEAAREVVFDWKWDADPAPGEEAKVALLVALGLRAALEEKP